MNIQVEIKDIEPIRVAYMKYIGLATKANSVFPDVFKSIMGKSNGAAFFSYQSMDLETKMSEMQLCVPTAQTPLSHGVQVQEMPRIKAVCVTHVGSYETLHYAYTAIEEFASAHKLELIPPFREVFIKGPGMLRKGNPNTYITEIQYPIKEDAYDCDSSKQHCQTV